MWIALTVKKSIS